MKLNAFILFIGIWLLQPVYGSTPCKENIDTLISKSPIIVLGEIKKIREVEIRSCGEFIIYNSKERCGSIWEIELQDTAFLKGTGNLPIQFFFVNFFASQSLFSPKSFGGCFNLEVGLPIISFLKEKKNELWTYSGSDSAILGISNKVDVLSSLHTAPIVLSFSIQETEIYPNQEILISHKFYNPSDYGINSCISPNSSWKFGDGKNTWSNELESWKNRWKNKCKKRLSILPNGHQLWEKKIKVPSGLPLGEVDFWIDFGLISKPPQGNGEIGNSYIITEKIKMKIISEKE
jgi:hypothetical protein